MSLDLIRDRCHDKKDGAMGYDMIGIDMSEDMLSLRQRSEVMMVHYIGWTEKFDHGTVAPFFMW